jgi:hypothetical protein
MCTESLNDLLCHKCWHRCTRFMLPFTSWHNSIMKLHDSVSQGLNTLTGQLQSNLWWHEEESKQVTEINNHDILFFKVNVRWVKNECKMSCFVIVSNKIF